MQVDCLFVCKRKQIHKKSRWKFSQKWNLGACKAYHLISSIRPNLLFQLMASVLNGHNVGTLWETARKFRFHYWILSACTVATNAEDASRVL